MGQRQPLQVQRDSATKSEHPRGSSRRKRNPVTPKEVHHNVSANSCIKKKPPLDRINAACLNETQIVANFIYFFANPNTSDTKPIHWMIQLASMVSDGSHIAHKSSILSASLALHSTIHGDNMIYANEARRWYGICLQTMRIRLHFLLPASCDYELDRTGWGRTRHQQGTEICAHDVSTSLMLAYYEIFSTTSQNAYFDHILAAARFLEALGPEMCQRGHLNSLYRSIKVHMLYVAIVKGYSPLLGSEAWKTIPLRFRPKTILGNIVDVLTSFFAALSGYTTGSTFSILPYIVELHSISELLLLDKATTATTHSLPREPASRLEPTSMKAKNNLYGYNLCRYHIPVESLLPSSPFALLDSEVVVTVAYYSLAWILILNQINIGSNNTNNEKPSLNQPNTDTSSDDNGIPDLTPIIQAHCSSILTAGVCMDSCEDGCGYIRMMIALNFVAHFSPDGVQRESALYRLELWRFNKGFKGGLFGSSFA